MAALPQRKRTPSFSSSVLDSIYRSIDQSDGLLTDLTRSIKNSNVTLSSSTSSSSSASSSPPNEKHDKLTTLRRAIMEDDHWPYTRSSTTTTNSSDSSSSEAKRRSKKLDERQRIKRTSVLDDDKNLKAAKMLEEIKRSKQPVSPGARLASFLNSIFQSNATKVKLCSVSTTTDIKSSSSKSCFSRTRHKTENTKRSVRLYPVRVTIDGDCRGFVQKNVTRQKKSIPELTAKKSVQKVTSLREEIKTKIDQTKLTCIRRKIGLEDSVRSYREEEEEDAWSCSSSDLFELDNNRIGMGRSIKELPVYETTDLKTNQAIARGLLL